MVYQESIGKANMDSPAAAAAAPAASSASPPGGRKVAVLGGTGATGKVALIHVPPSAF